VKRYRPRPRHAVCSFLAALAALVGDQLLADAYVIDLEGHVILRPDDAGVWN
jgi:hypothetical protein